MGKQKIRFVLGGFHVQADTPNDEVLRKTIEYFAGEQMEISYPCHCTNLLAKTELSRVMRIGEVGSGTCIAL